jgi:DNA relaxase NicK
MSESGYAVGVHWLRCGFDEARLSDALTLMVRLFGDEFDMTLGKWGYAHAYTWTESQSHISFDAGMERGHYERASLEVTGKALDQLSREQVCDLLNGLEALGDYRCTRLDLFIDDLDRRIDLAEVYRCHQEGRVAGPRKARLGQESKPGEVTSDMIAFGSRGKKGNGRYWRFYDKRLESKGRNPAIRVEVELTDAKAHDALAYLQANMDTFERSIGQIVTTGIDFFDVKKKNLSRSQRCPWWQAVLDAFPALKYQQPVKENSLDSVIGWLMNAVAPSMGMLRKAMGREGYYHLCDSLANNGEHRLSDKHKRILRACKEGSKGLAG